MYIFKFTSVCYGPNTLYFRRRHLSRQLLKLHRESWAGSLHVLPEEEEETEQYHDEEDGHKNQHYHSDHNEDNENLLGDDVVDNFKKEKSELELYFLTL